MVAFGGLTVAAASIVAPIAAPFVAAASEAFAASIFNGVDVDCVANEKIEKKEIVR